MLADGGPEQGPVFVPAPERVAASQLTAFMEFCACQTGRTFGSFDEFDTFSVTEFRTFWSLFLRWSGLVVEGPREPVCEGDDCETARFFPQLRLNYVENLLHVESAEDRERPAIRLCSVDEVRVQLTRGELLDRVVAAASALERLGLSAGDHVVAVVHHDADAIIGALAALRLGATVSCADPSMGTFSILARFRQLEPTLLLGHVGQATGRPGAALADELVAIAAGLSSLKAFVALDGGDLPLGLSVPAARLADLVEQLPAPAPVTWQRFPFNHPLFIVFSSGTTGPPKCIVHGAGGTLLEHVKEHRLHTDLRAGQSLLFQTSAAWMMWNWQLSALASDVELVLHDGGLTDPDVLWRLTEQQAITVVGSNPAFLQMSELSGARVRDRFNLSRMSALLSTGAPLSARQMCWLTENVAHVPVMSISGGTDILGCFVLGNPNLPVYPGQAQCRSLGLDVDAQPAPGLLPPHVGDLVCRNPFPSRPLGFLRDDDGTRFHEAYFAANPGVWTHGDLIELTPEGGARVHGRSDAVLNVGGIRIGPAEIYRILEAVPGIRESLVVEQRSTTDALRDRLVLLLVMERPGLLTPARVKEIRRELALHGSTHHVPGLIVEVPELPVTFSGKRSEHAARDTLNGRSPSNLEALRNPGSLATIAWQVRLEDGRVAVGAEESLPDLSADDLERLVISAWQDVLGLTQIELTDDFFALGGTSLQVMKIFDLIRERQGTTLPLSTMYNAATPAALADVLRTGEQGGTDVAVLLRPGQGRPLFLLHDLTGDVLYQRPLVLALQTDRPVYGLRAPELDGRHDPLVGVTEMASYYLDHIRQLQPQGPYTLLGYSFGGLVALELARALRHEAEETDFLGVIDTYLPPPTAAGRALRGVTRTVGLAGPVLRAPRSRVPRMLRRFAERRLPWLGIRATDADVLVPPGIDSCVRANRSYRPGRYQGDVAFYLSQQRRPGYPRPDLAWRAVVDGQLSIQTVPGDHFSLMRPPHSDELARQVSRSISAAAARAESAQS